jgi:CheY-like chemotaxis protein
MFWFEIPYRPDLDFVRNMSELSVTVHANNVGQVTDFHHTEIPPSKPIVLQKVDNKTLTSSGSGSGLGQKSLNILLVEDTLSIQKMTKMLLQKQGHTVTVADNGVIALDQITAMYEEEQKLMGSDQPTCRFDVVLMDFQMPVMDGLEATRRIRALEAQMRKDFAGEKGFVPKSFYHQLIIGLSANSDDETVQLARSEGMDDFMEKPFKAAVFNAILSKTILK